MSFNNGPRTTDHGQFLSRLNAAKRIDTKIGVPLGPEMVGFFKQSVAKRHTKLGQIAGSWSLLVPETLNEHCSLESLHRGVLTVIVDSPSHLYDLKHLLLAGLQQQLLLACKAAGVRKIALRPGRWYDDTGGSPKPSFD